MDFDYWNGPAGQRWANTYASMDAILHPFAEALIDAADIPAQGVVVDVGCGCGATTFMVAERHPDVDAIGIDISAPMLAVARRRAPREGRVRFEHGDAATARPQPAVVDRVISRFGVMFFPDPVAAFANLRRWLPDEGTFAAIVWGPVHENSWAFDLLQIVGKYTDAQSTDTDGPGPFSLASPSVAETALLAGGFARVEQQWLDLPLRIPGTHEDLVDFFLHRGPVANAVAELDSGPRAALIQELRHLADLRHDGTGAPLTARSRLIHGYAT